MSRCVICGDRRLHAKDRCMTCYRYRHRNGDDRTEEHVTRLTRRDVERTLARRFRC